MINFRGPYKWALLYYSISYLYSVTRHTVTLSHNSKSSLVTRVCEEIDHGHGQVVVNCEFLQGKAEVIGGRRPNKFLGQSLNDRTILFLVVLLYKTASVG